jgi:hypothetical protein
MNENPALSQLSPAMLDAMKLYCAPAGNNAAEDALLADVFSRAEANSKLAEQAAANKRAVLAAEEAKAAAYDDLLPAAYAEMAASPPAKPSKVSPIVEVAEASMSGWQRVSSRVALLALALGSSVRLPGFAMPEFRFPDERQKSWPPSGQGAREMARRVRQAQASRSRQWGASA